SDLRVPKPVGSGSSSSLHLDEFEIVFRLPNSSDLAALANFTEIGEARMRLLKRVITRITRSEQLVAIESLPEAVVGRLEAGIAGADPQGEVFLDLSCQNCGIQWQALFDIVPFLWTEIDAWAVRLLRDVHSLSRAYGWREVDMLAMSPRRR